MHASSNYKVTCTDRVYFDLNVQTSSLYIFLEFNDNFLTGGPVT